MNENYETLLVKTDTFEPFVLCLALGTLEAIKSEIWSTEAGIWTIGRPNFLDELEKMNVSEETKNILVEFDELNALQDLVSEDDFNEKLSKIEQNIKKRLEDFSGSFWSAKWANENS
ncbi:MAG: DUF3969 family protein [Pyrinomonadaceae bacterium]|nr:DUF3969 family protein [Pyrinomonadaceae bacterium]